MVFNSPEMVIHIVKLPELCVVKSAMEDVGSKPKMEGHILLALMAHQTVANARLDLGVMESTIVKILMNAKRNQLANAQSANAKIHGAVTSAAAAVVHCTCTSMIHASVKMLTRRSAGALFG